MFSDFVVAMSQFAIAVAIAWVAVFVNWIAQNSARGWKSSSGKKIPCIDWVVMLNVVGLFIWVIGTITMVQTFRNMP